MVKRKRGGKRRDEQGQNGVSEWRKAERTIITPDTPYGECLERLTAFGGLLACLCAARRRALVKFLDLIGFEDAFAEHYLHPKGVPRLGGYWKVLGMLMLLFIGFQRLGHFAYVRGDGEFIGWNSIKACPDKEFFFTFGNKRCDPPFPEGGWYRHGEYEYNECVYQPLAWEQSRRFVVMRIREDQRGERQLKLLESENYVYRVFATNEQGHPHRVIADYDQQADADNLIGGRPNALNPNPVPCKKYRVRVGKAVVECDPRRQKQGCLRSGKSAYWRKIRGVRE